VQDSKCRVTQVMGRFGTVKPQRDRAPLPMARVYLGLHSPLRHAIAVWLLRFGDVSEPTPHQVDGGFWGHVWLTEFEE
jgi:hypothetical protein